MRKKNKISKFYCLWFWQAAPFSSQHWISPTDRFWALLKGVKIWKSNTVHEMEMDKVYIGRNQGYYL